MLRGKQKLYNNLVPENTPTAGVKNQRNTFIDNRRIKLAHRYYFYVIICRKRYDDCINELSYEFDLGGNTIIKDVEEKYDLVKQLTQNQTTTADLKKIYPFFNWVARIA